MNYLPYIDMPLAVRVAIERLDADSTLRTAAMLDTLIDRYATVMGATLSHEVRLSAQRIACRRFPDFKADHCRECGEVFPCSDYRRTDVMPYITVRHQRKGQ